MLIALSIDGLSAGALGCYGNDWVGTPAIDALAAESVLFDFAISDTPSLNALRSFWSGRSEVSRRLAPADAAATEQITPPALASVWKSAGWRSLLFTDDRSILQFPEAAAFQQQVSMNAPSTPKIADDASETHLAAFFANAADALLEFQQESPNEESVVWLHTNSLGNVWDAPLAYRYRYLEEGDPPPPEFAQPPARRLAADEPLDPDDLLGLRRAYAGQVTLLDELLETLLGFLQEAGLLSQCHLLLLAPRGLPLGEHGLIGYPSHEFSLHEECLHVPLLWRFPDDAGESNRHASEHVQALVQPADLLPTMMALLAAAKPEQSLAHSDGVSFASAISNMHESPRQLALATMPEATGGSYAIRAASWQLIQSLQNGEPETRLYAKPDDRGEMNNVADICPEVVAMLQEHARRIMAGEANAATVVIDDLLTALH